VTTFDQILPAVAQVLGAHRTQLTPLAWLVINRDLIGRVRFIVPESIEADRAQRESLRALYQELSVRIQPHAYGADDSLLYDADLESACAGSARRTLQGFDHVWVVDRLATEGDWTQIAPETEGAPRVVFFSIKGGVGRSTALAACAWKLAQVGKRVLVLDLDLESPGLSSSLLPEERQPLYGVTDWLVEDLVDNADGIIDDMVATSDLSREGQIYVALAHGADPGEYVLKLGRIWMPKVRDDGPRETWSARLQRLLQMLEARLQPDVVLIDSRAGIDEVASACVSDLGANLVLLFATEGSQTWTGYRILFEHWRRGGVAPQIRERLRHVAAMVPDVERIAYLEGLRERAHGVFADTLYDDIRPANPAAISYERVDGHAVWKVGEVVEGWNFDEADEGAPHYPWVVHWHRSFAGLRSLQGRLAVIDDSEVTSVFGSLIDGVRGVLHD